MRDGVPENEPPETGEMRYVVISDVHANLPALEAVVQAVEGQSFDGWLCCGDVVGYGPMPNDVVAAMRALGARSVAGNHDLVVTGRLDISRCGTLARQTLEWTDASLTPTSREALERLPPLLVVNGVAMAHGSIEDPERYVRAESVTSADLDRLKTLDGSPSVLLLGHTHRPLAVCRDRGVMLDGSTGTVTFRPEVPVLLNPGSVGQSRQRLPRAQFMVLDLEQGRAEFRSVRYDTKRVRRALREAGLPDGAYHDRPSASNPAAVALVKSTPRPIRRAYRRLRRGVIG